jgi:hypothetical protein
MGTWGYGLNENDTSFDVTETFFEKYNTGMEPLAIRKDILEQFAYSLNDSEDSDNVLFPLAKCLWEVCGLDKETLVKVKERIEGGGNIEVVRFLGADDEFLKKRGAMLNKFLAKISIPKERPKVRKKPPVHIDSPYRTGSCLSFQYPDGTFGGAVVIGSELYNTKGCIYISLTDIRSPKPPVFNDFESAKLLDFEWEWVHGQAERNAAIQIDGKPHTGRVHQHRLDYDRKDERDTFFEQFGRVFGIAGELPKFTQILCTTTWIKNPLLNTPQMLDYYYGLRGEKYHPISNETLQELAAVLSIRRVAASSDSNKSNNR